MDFPSTRKGFLRKDIHPKGVIDLDGKTVQTQTYGLDGITIQSSWTEIHPNFNFWSSDGYPSRTRLVTKVSQS